MFKVLTKAEVKEIEKKLEIVRERLRKTCYNFYNPSNDYEYRRLCNKLDRNVRNRLKNDLEKFNQSKKSLVMYKKVYALIHKRDRSGMIDIHKVELIAELHVKRGVPRLMGYDQLNNVGLANHHRYKKERCKFRVAEATVVSLTYAHSRNGRKCGKKIKAFSGWDNLFYYEVGAVVKPNYKFSINLNKHCASGIHGFLDRDKALEW